VAIKLSSCLTVALPVGGSGGGGISVCKEREMQRCVLGEPGRLESMVKHKPRCTLIGNELDLLTFLDRDDFCHLKLRASL